MDARTRTDRRRTCGRLAVLGAAAGLSLAAAFGIATYVLRATGGSDVAGRAERNADLVRSVERAVGLERGAAALHDVGRTVPDEVEALVYAAGYWPFLAVGLVVAHRLDRTTFHRTWFAVAASGLVGLLVMAWFPVAPPRLLGEPDLVAAHGMSAIAHPDGLVNPHAAMPSFHVGWSLLAALAIAAAVPGRWGGIALAHPAAMAFVVVTTQNHHPRDVAVGAALAAAAWWCAGQWRPIGRGVVRCARSSAEA